MPARSPKFYSFEQFAAMRRYFPVLDFSPDGREVAYITNISGQYNLWREDARGGYPRQLTLFSERAVRDFAWSPGGKLIAFNADVHGNEMHQLFVIPAAGGEPDQLTHMDDVQHVMDVHSWSPSGRYLAYSANDRERRDVDVVVRDMKTGELIRLLSGDAAYYFAGWSPDGRYLLAAKQISNLDRDIFLIDFKARTTRNLSAHEGAIEQYPVGWAADGSGFFLLSDAGREFLGLARYDLATGKQEWIETPRWPIEMAEVSADGRRLAWSVNENGISRLFVRDLKRGKALDVPGLPRGEAMALACARDGGKLALILSRAVHCSEVYVLDLRARALEPITHSMLGGVDERDMVEPQLVHFTTFDERKLPAFLYRPKGVTGRVPAVLSIHGGPEGQERPMYLYSGLYQYLLNRGIAVLAPNIRGSSGYGKSYQRLIYGDWGGAELRDIEAAAQYLQSLDWVDAQRLGVFGGSFGGFATLSAVSRLPQYWAVAVDIVGPSNLVTFVDSVPPHWRRFTDEWVGNAERDREKLLARSPISYVDQIRCPLFIIQGANDPRVVKAESDQIVERLHARGVDVRYDVYADEGHGFTKRSNELKAFKDSAEFLAHHLARDARA